MFKDLMCREQLTNLDVKGAKRSVNLILDQVSTLVKRPQSHSTVFQNTVLTSSEIPRVQAAETFSKKFL